MSKGQSQIFGRDKILSSSIMLKIRNKFIENKFLVKNQIRIKTIIKIYFLKKEMDLLKKFIFFHKFYPT